MLTTIELDGKFYNFPEDIEDIDWVGKESEEDTASYYKEEIIFIITTDGEEHGIHKSDLDPEVREYVNQYVDPM